MLVTANGEEQGVLAEQRTRRDCKKAWHTKSRYCFRYSDTNNSLDDPSHTGVDKRVRVFRSWCITCTPLPTTTLFSRKRQVGG